MWVDSCPPALCSVTGHRREVWRGTDYKRWFWWYPVRIVPDTDVLLWGGVLAPLPTFPSWPPPQGKVLSLNMTSASLRSCWPPTVTHRACPSPRGGHEYPEALGLAQPGFFHWMIPTSAATLGARPLPPSMWAWTRLAGMERGCWNG